MNNTYQILINWDKGQAFAERMAAKILHIEAYEEIDPQSPVGGPDGTKDILCSKNDNDYIVGCYFPNGQKAFKDIKDKFDGDIGGVVKNDAEGFIFVTNQKLTPSERIALCSGHTFESTIYHGERVCGILDSPKGYGVRLEYLGIELTKEEQISFLQNHLDLKQNFERIEKNLMDLMKVTNKMVGEIYSRDIYNSVLSSFPIAGITFSSRLSIEDLLTLHMTIIQETQGKNYFNNIGFRKLDVWIGTPGSDKDTADFIPASPIDVPNLVYELIKWWREEYMKVVHSIEINKISAIATFHEKFLSIHPFLDGNGRIARTIASIQFKDLLDRDVIFEGIERSEYYKALQNSRNGNRQELNDIFTALIKE